MNVIDMSDCYPFKTYDEFTVWLEGTDPMDKWGLYKKPSNLVELEYNLMVYRQYGLNKVILPKPVHEQLALEFKEIRKLRG